VDALNRVVEQVYTDGTRHTASFDAVGRQTSMGDPSPLTTWTHDGAGRVVTVNDWFGRPLTLSHGIYAPSA
jgi:uncharacterized protein RhaS with RHS repeats